jgi:hypothetical protein
LINEQFDIEFKLYLHNNGINIDGNIFEVKFNPPQNFASYRQAEMDTARIQTFTGIVQVPFVSKRFALKRFLGLTTEEMAENELQWRQENIDDDTVLPANAELRSVGITASGLGADISNLSGATAAPAPEDISAAPGGTPPESTPPPA